MNDFLVYFLILIIYSFFGWCCEVLYGLIMEKRLINRGFLIGPVCPIYGFGAIFMILFLTKYKSDPITVFVLGAVICSILEYFTSYIMEKLFNARWWDYSYIKFNINGRICLPFSCLFGILGVILICFVNPFVNSLIDMIPDIYITIISIILIIIFLSDIIISFNIINKIKLTAQNVSKDYTEEINKKVKEKLKNKLLQSRLLKAFPKFNFINHQKNTK